MVDFSSPLRAMIPYLTRIFHLNKGQDEYCFRKFRLTETSKIEVLKFVNSNLTLKEQAIKPGSCVVLLPLSVFYERPLDQFSPDDVAKSGWLFKNSQKGDKKPTPVKKRWCVLTDHFLFYFADNKASSKPSGVINLEHVAINYDNNNIKLKSITQSFKHSSVVYNFFTDTESITKDWSQCMKQHCFNGDPHRVFGVPLTKLLKAKRDVFGPLVKSLNYLDARALDKEKLFQLKGESIQLNDFRESFDRGKDVDLSICEDPYIVADLLKLFLKELPEPLLTFDLYPVFLATKPELVKYNELLSKLPLAHQIVVEILLHFAARLLLHSKKNGLEWDNIALMLGPSFLRPVEPLSPEAALAVMPEVNAILKYLVSNRQLLSFPKPIDDKHELKLKLKNQTQVKAIYDYQSRGQTNAQGEIDIGFPKDSTMDVIDERGNSGWIKVRLDGKEGLVPRNYVYGIDPVGQIEVAIKKKGRKKRDSRKTLKYKTSRPKSGSKSKLASESDYQQHKDKEIKGVVKVQEKEIEKEEKVKTVPEEDYKELEQKYYTEVSRRNELEIQLANLRAEFEDYKGRFGPTNQTVMELPPLPPAALLNLPPPPLTNLPPPMLATPPPPS